MSFPAPNAGTEAFRLKSFPNASLQEWNDWRWQMRNRVRDLPGLERLFRLTRDEREAVTRRQGPLPAGITPYYASLLNERDASQPLRRTMIPSMAEFERAPGERDDPLGEDEHSPVPGLVHTYPDKVLFLVTDVCATYCRYCTRSRMVGGGEFLPDRRMWEDALEYLRSHTEVRDVLLSGGDPLILSDERLGWLLERLRGIPHIEIVRLGTKVPVVMPQRVTESFTEMIQRYHPVWMSIHFTHPDELTPECEAACERLADAGVPMGSQTVLLADVNDRPETMKELMVGLLRCRVRPYYLLQCDPVVGSAHFKTPIGAGQDIIRALHGHTTGYAVPHYMIDAPGGGGKVPVPPDYVAGRADGDLLLKGYDGRLYRYPEFREEQNTGVRPEI